MPALKMLVVEDDRIKQVVTRETLLRWGLSVQVVASTAEALTAHAMKGFEEECIAAGMDKYVAKPLSAAELKRVPAAYFKE